MGREQKALGSHFLFPNILQRPRIFWKTDRILPISPVKNYPMGQNIKEKSVDRQSVSFAILACALARARVS